MKMNSTNSSISLDVAAKFEYPALFLGLLSLCAMTILGNQSYVILPYMEIVYDSLDCLDCLSVPICHILYVIMSKEYADLGYHRRLTITKHHESEKQSHSSTIKHESG